MVEARSPLPIDVISKNVINSLEVIEITEDRNSKINKFFQYLIGSYFPFDVLCWALAELQLIFEKGSKNYSESEVVNRAEDIIDSNINYDTFCLLITHFKIYLEEIELYP